MALPPYIRAQGNGTVLRIKVQPRGSQNKIDDPLGDELKIKVTAPPVDAAANEALIRLLAELLNCPKGSVQLVRGQTSRHKIIFLQGLDPETVLAKLHPSSE